MKNFQTILEFQKLLKKFNQVYRDCNSLHHRAHVDNDVEHSYRVAMLCWMIADEYNLKLNIDKVIKYALAHDLVEIYAGDVSIYKKHANTQKNKELREHESLLRLKKEFPKLKSLWNSIDAYEKRKDEESKFVYLIEKLEPILLVILSERDHYKKKKITLKDFTEIKQRKIKDIDTFAQIFNKEIFEYLEKNKKKLFF